MNKIKLVVPVFNEEKILEKFFKKLKAQTIESQLHLIVIDNDSEDNSLDIIKNWKNKFYNPLTILNYSHAIKEYDVGEKYSSIIDFGFSYIQKCNDYTHIGILDSDCFLYENYYELLIQEFNKNKNLGLTSGIPYFSQDKIGDGERENAVRGNCMLWNRACFEDSGYVIGPSSDTLSLGLVEIRGWDAYSTKEAKLECREMGVVGDYSFYGSSAYYRGIEPFIASIKYFRLLIKFGFNTSWKYIKGYFGSYIKGDKRLENKELRNYFSKISYKRALQELKLSFQKNKK